MNRIQLQCFPIINDIGFQFFFQEPFIPFSIMATWYILAIGIVYIFFSLWGVKCLYPTFSLHCLEKFYILFFKVDPNSIMNILLWFLSTIVNIKKRFWTALKSATSFFTKSLYRYLMQESAIRSIPIPKAKPEYSFGIRATLVSTLGSTIPQSP